MDGKMYLSFSVHPCDQLYCDMTTQECTRVHFNLWLWRH